MRQLRRECAPFCLLGSRPGGHWQGRTALLPRNARNALNPWQAVTVSRCTAQGSALTQAMSRTTSKSER